MMNSMNFNDERKDYVIVLERGRPYWSPIKREIRTIGNKHRLRKTEHDPAIIPVTIRIEADSKEQLLRRGEEVAEWLNQKEAKPLVFDDDKSRTQWALLDGNVDVDEIVTFSTASLDFIVLYKTGAVVTIPITNAFKTHKIKGQLETPWISKTTFTANAKKFMIESEDGFIELNYSFIVGDVLTIDYLERKIFVSDIEIDVGLSLESIWFPLRPENMEFKASHKTDLIYYERYH